jgi:bifunctional DNA-binding transcriptional regulator/antitoxin component of YhaV-PrlF toxin-antitoxin module
MSIIEVDKRYRITLSKEIRGALGIKKGQKLYALATQKEIILIPLPDDPLKRLAELVGDVQFNREVREKAEEYIRSQAG